MAAVMMTPDDLRPFAEIELDKAGAMIDSALARAARVAPCIRDATLSDDNSEAAKGIIRDAILRWNDAGSGALQSQTAGPFGQGLDTRTPRKVLFWPSEITELQAICADHAGTAGASAFSVDTAPDCGLAGHSPFCDLFFGGTTCSCGANLTNYEYPLYEVY